MSNLNIPESAVAAYESDQKRYEGGGQEWHEFIQGRIESAFYRIQQDVSRKLDKNMSYVLNELQTWMQEDDEVNELLANCFLNSWKDNGATLDNLKDKVLASYCLLEADRLESLFATEYAEWSAEQ